MDIPTIIETAGGRDAIANATGVTADAIYKWPKIGIPDRHWGDLIRLSGNKLTPAILHAANQKARGHNDQSPREGKEVSVDQELEGGPRHPEPKPPDEQQEVA